MPRACPCKACRIIRHDRRVRLWQKHGHRHRALLAKIQGPNPIMLLAILAILAVGTCSFIK